MPATDALVFPSTFPESFGMVAAEAAAAGVLPVSAGALGRRRGQPGAGGGAAARRSRELVSFPLDDGAVSGIAERLNAWLRLDEATRERARRALADGGVGAVELGGRGARRARRLRGRLDELAPVPD